MSEPPKVPQHWRKRVFCVCVSIAFRKKKTWGGNYNYRFQPPRTDPRKHVLLQLKVILFTSVAIVAPLFISFCDAMPNCDHSELKCNVELGVIWIGFWALRRRTKETVMRRWWRWWTQYFLAGGEPVFGCLDFWMHFIWTSRLPFWSPGNHEADTSALIMFAPIRWRGRVVVVGGRGGQI